MTALVPERARRLHTARLTLEPLREAHAAEMFDGLRDPALYRYLTDRPPPSVEALAARYRSTAPGRSADGADLWCNWIIRRDLDRRCLGTVQATMTDIAAGPDEALIGYMILPAFWRQGVGSEAVDAMLACLFGDYRCRQAQAMVDARNRPSLALLSRLGFSVAGRAPAEDGDGEELELALDGRCWHGWRS